MEITNPQSVFFDNLLSRMDLSKLPNGLRACAESLKATKPTTKEGAKVAISFLLYLESVISNRFFVDGLGLVQY